MRLMKTKQLFLFTTGIILFCVSSTAAQDLMGILEKETPQMPLYTQATFKTNRVVLSQSVETRKKGTLEFILGTRYWNIPNNENSQSFGADRFSAHYGMQYAFSDRFTFGAGINSADGILNSFAKYRLLRQRQDTNVPLGITLVQGVSYFSRSSGIFTLPQDSGNRASYISQVIMARKFNQNLSLQLSPTYIRASSGQPIVDENNIFTLGFAGRYKLGNHVSLSSEYSYMLNRDIGEEGYNTFALGVNWEVGDLIMQFSMSNNKSFDDIAIISFSPNNFHFRPGGLHIGVNATYVLHLRKKKTTAVKAN